MKSLLLVATLIGSALISNATMANADDAKWIAQCVMDNKDERATPEVITKYCTCMNGKMGDNETQSITQWEKTHATERQACDKEAGWR
jgi:hypothetical protein